MIIHKETKSKCQGQFLGKFTRAWKKCEVKEQEIKEGTMRQKRKPMLC